MTTDTIAVLAGHYQASLEARNASPKTIATYLAGVRSFESYAISEGLPVSVGKCARAHVEAWITHILERCTPGTAATRHAGLRSFFAWCVTEGEIAESPMRNVPPPRVPESPVPIASEDALKALLRACGASRRDTALVLVMLDTGCRVGELTSMTLDGVDLVHSTIAVMGKGGRPRVLPLGYKSALALRRYLRERGDAPGAVWLGLGGEPLGTSGVRQVLKRRCVEAGIPPLHPHQLRHSFVHA